MIQFMKQKFLGEKDMPVHSTHRIRSFNFTLLSRLSNCPSSPVKGLQFFLGLKIISEAVTVSYMLAKDKRPLAKTKASQSGHPRQHDLHVSFLHVGKD